ncbi:MAG: hypothetical protein JW791_01425 [Nanoarchaeota archaeon]|nr:hypothetical protein [Nanoarchaeota archaeon]
MVAEKIKSFRELNNVLQKNLLDVNKRDDLFKSLALYLRKESEKDYLNDMIKYAKKEPGKSDRCREACINASQYYLNKGNIASYLVNYVLPGLRTAPSQNRKHEELEKVVEIVQEVSNNFTFEKVSLGNAVAIFDILENLCAVYYNDFKEEEVYDRIETALIALDGIDKVVKEYEKEVRKGNSVTIEEIMKNLTNAGATNELLSTEVLDCINQGKIDFLKMFTAKVNDLFQMITQKYLPNIALVDSIVTEVPESIILECRQVISECSRKKKR